MSLTAPRDTPQMGNGPIASLYGVPLKAGVIFYPGQLVALNTSNYGVPATADPTLRVVGVCSDRPSAAARRSDADRGGECAGLPDDGRHQHRR